MLGRASNLVCRAILYVFLFLLMATVPLAAIATEHLNKHLYLKGLVVDCSGRPVEGVSVMLVSKAEKELVEIHAIARTDSNGVYSIPLDRIRSGTYDRYNTYEVTLWSRDYPARPSESKVVKPDPWPRTSGSAIGTVIGPAFIIECP